MQVGRELFGLTSPGVHKAGRDDQQHRALHFSFSPCLQERECLNRLAKPHIIGTHASESRLKQRCHPGTAISRIIAQLRS